MSALLTYRSRNSFEQRFGRKNPSLIKKAAKSKVQQQETRPPLTPQEEHWAIHNEGNRRGRKLQTTNSNSNNSTSLSNRSNSSDSITSTASTTTSSTIHHKHQTYFSAQSYLRYQGEKFIDRFDANCYIAISRKLDTHDITRERTGTVSSTLESLLQPTLVIGISSDGLFTYSEQETLARYIPNSKLEKIDSPEGHDAFLLEFAAINQLIIEFLKANCSEIANSEGVEWEEEPVTEIKESVFGEAEDVTNW
jgi:homoserine O-acetyltransferase